MILSKVHACVSFVFAIQNSCVRPPVSAVDVKQQSVKKNCNSTIFQLYLLSTLARAVLVFRFLQDQGMVAKNTFLQTIIKKKIKKVQNSQKYKWTKKSTKKISVLYKLSLKKLSRSFKLSNIYINLSKIIILSFKHKKNTLKYEITKVTKK